MRGRLSTKLAAAMAVVAIVTAALALPAAIVYTEHRLDGLPRQQRDEALAQIELNSWDDFDGLAEWAVVTLVAGTVAVAIGWLLARRMVRPLRTISGTARQLAQGDLDARSGLHRRDELGQLADDVDAMANDLQRLENERRTAAAATAHELRNPVTILRGRLQGARDGLLQLDDDEIALLIDQLDGLTRIIEDLRILSLATAGRLVILPEPIDLTDLVSTQVAALVPFAAEHDVRLVFDPGPRVVAMADSDRLAQALTNVTINAVRHSPPGHDVQLGCRTRRAPDGAESAEITVTDAGPGFPDELGDPFTAFTTGDASGGSGLGLAIVKAIIEAHGGSVAASNRSAGSVVTLTIPAGRMPSAT